MEDASSTVQCPRGHRLPFNTPKGQCTPLYCAAPDMKALKQEANETQKAVDKALADVDNAENAESNKLDLAEARLRERFKRLNVIESDDPVAVEEWADKKMTQLLKPAMAVLEGRLRWGNDDQQWQAVQQVLNSTGRGKREAIGNMTAPIVIVADPNSALTNPWLQRAAPKVVAALVDDAEE